MVSHLNFTDIATIPRWLEMSRNQIPYLLHICFRTILTLSAFHIGRKVALDAQAAALVYIYARISQIAEMTLSFYVTGTNKVQNSAHRPIKSRSESHLHVPIQIMKGVGVTLHQSQT